MIDMRKAPFNLDDEQIKWVEEIRSSFTNEEKVGQLFFLAGFTPTEDELLKMLDTFKQPGGLMYRPFPKEVVTNVHKTVQNRYKAPLFLAANTEAGGNGLILEGTAVGPNMQCAATGSSEYAFKQAIVASRELKSVGGNMSFAPVIDINFNANNPITNTRAYSDNPEFVKECASQATKAKQESGIAACIKHFPGDGHDDRDHHLLVTHNGLSYEDWMKTYGEIYKACINEGALSLMVGHITLPGYYKEKHPDVVDANKIPASISKELLQDLLRGELAFNGLIMTDATMMAGFTANHTREEALVKAVNAGCDMILFVRNPLEDYTTVLNAFNNGEISQQRLDEAVTRILATKAALNLHDKSTITFDGACIGCEDHLQIAKEVADKSITLVRKDDNHLPMKQGAKVGVITLGDDSALFGGEPKENEFVEELNANGFKAERIKFDTMGDMFKFSSAGVKALQEKYDYIIYAAYYTPSSNSTNLRVSYKALGFDAPWFVKEIPTLFVSFGNPYHHHDADCINTFINAYSSYTWTIKAVVEKLMGKSEFIGVSPVNVYNH